MIDSAVFNRQVEAGPSRYQLIRSLLVNRPRRWLVTGAAGFIGSNLVEALVGLGQDVVGLDNFATGRRENLESLLTETSGAGGRFSFIEGDIRDLDVCHHSLRGVNIVLHQAAIGSVPRSIDDPLRTHDANVNGTVNMLEAARRANVDRFVYACSSSTYGDHPGLPKVEEEIGRALSPYSASKHVGEIYAGVFQRTYGLQTVGLRYFNVFGRRQDPEGEYAAVIPRWISLLLAGRSCEIYGDGETSRDFCYIENVIQANILSGLAPAESTDAVYNVACGERTTLNSLYRLICDGLARWDSTISTRPVVYRDFRAGDVRHSHASITKARAGLGYFPTHSVERGLEAALAWYVNNLEPLSLSAAVADVRGAPVGVVVQELVQRNHAARSARRTGLSRRGIRRVRQVARHPGPVARGVLAALQSRRWTTGARMRDLLNVDIGEVSPARPPASGTVLPPTWKVSQAAAYATLRQLSRLPGARWRDTCLYRSVASCLILRGLDVKAHLRVGVQRELLGGESFPAHAWTVAGDAAVTPAGGDLVPLRRSPVAADHSRLRRPSGPRSVPARQP